MANMKLRTNEKGEEFYDVYYKIPNNEKEKHTKVYIKQHGKYAKLIAEKALNEGIRVKNWYEEHDDIITLFYYQDTTDKYYEIFIDKEDLELVKDYYWHIKKDGNEYYAYTNYDRNKSLYIHRLVMNVTNTNDIIDHINGNGLNNIKSNLRVTNICGNNRNKVNMNKSNKTGTMGVQRRKNDYAAFYTDSNGLKKTKAYSVNKYGEEQAKQMAINMRKLMEETDDNTKI